MTTDPTPCDESASPNELTPEQAREKRKYHLALARERARAATEQDNKENDGDETTVAAFILPGGD
jgi:hypothetical protein